MTKKDYELIAGVISDSRSWEGVEEGAVMGDSVLTEENHSSEQNDFIQTAFVRRLSAEDPRFNEEKFIAACK